MICTRDMDSLTPESLSPEPRTSWDADALIEAALAVMPNASVPLSRFRVGSAVLTVGGRIFEGCNTESLIPILGCCAERNAMNHALIHGEKSFVAVSVVSDLHAPLLPCGACLQYLQEFAKQDDRDILIIAQGRSGDRVVTSVRELLKGGFPEDTTVRDLQESFSWSVD